MPVYTPPALNAVDFELVVQPSHSVAPYVMTLTSYTVPALNAVDFALVTYTQPDYNTIDFELLDAIITYYGILKYWTGAIWERGLLKSYNGGSFVAKPLKLWDGAIWQDIDATG
jgi:hypothetical protein